MNYKCPCCGYYTFPERPGGTYEVCPVCFWEDDKSQLEDINYDGGANRVSLIRARENFFNCGAIELRLAPYVRKANEDELTGIDWQE